MLPYRARESQDAGVLHAGMDTPGVLNMSDFYRDNRYLVIQGIIWLCQIFSNTASPIGVVSRSFGVHLRMEVYK